METNETIEFLRSLNPQDLRRIEKYSELLEEAEDAMRTILSSYKFDLRQDKILVYNDGCNSEYLLHSGVWEARYLYLSYDVKVTVEGIFDIFKEEYEHRLSKSVRVNNKADSAIYFRSFIARTKEKNKST